MKIKYTYPFFEVEDVCTYTTNDISKGSEFFFSSIPQKIKTYRDVEVFIINYDINEDKHDNFFMAIEVPHEEADQKFQEILDICLPNIEIKKHKFHKKNEKSLYIYEVQANYLFEEKLVKPNSIPNIYEKLTNYIFDTCLENEFYFFSKSMYKKLEDSSIVFKNHTNYSYGYCNLTGNKNCNILLYLMSKFVIEDSRDVRIINFLFNCRLMAKSLRKKFSFVNKNDCTIISKFIFTLYKIGLNNFSFQKHIKDIIFYYCSSKDRRTNSNWYTNCSNLKCVFYKNDEKCNDVVSPFNHIFRKTNTHNHTKNKHYKCDYNKPLHIKSFFSK